MVFELHEVIPYLLSISIICSFAYAAYFTRQSIEDNGGWSPERFIWVPLILLVHQVSSPDRTQHWLVRKVKRKESPDGESADCSSSLRNQEHTQRGGFLWRQLQTKHSPFLKDTAF
ncbi:hypothetical protein [Paenibacillus radicis (ex Gao et al. 2016)]|uniref:hypothetical protein n=1 Tax=Paenibacillus radicis (ex Gao et al. 2016) TaxID=1737354 RepID=UPI0016685303|nr:hypothetical protein [Paenibacillus radicis (ex Gao et al. 2016)]